MVGRNMLVNRGVVIALAYGYGAKNDGHILLSADRQVRFGMRHGPRATLPSWRVGITRQENRQRARLSVRRTHTHTVVGVNGGLRPDNIAVNRRDVSIGHY